MRNSAILTVPLLVLLATGEASAHAFLDHAEPRVGNTVATAPREVTLWFTQKLEPAFSTITVTTTIRRRSPSTTAAIISANAANALHPADLSRARPLRIAVELHEGVDPAALEHVGEALQEIGRFKPDALVHALGFDIYEDDPQSQVEVTTDGFGRLGLAIGALNTPIVIVQEGGYHIESLEANARAFFGGFQSGRRAE